MLPADLFVRGLKIADNLSKKYKLPIPFGGICCLTMSFGM